MSQDLNNVVNDVPEYMNELIPYRCPKCGHLRRFATLRELRQHLQRDHSFQMGFVKPHTRANIFDSDTKSSPRSEKRTNRNKQRYGSGPEMGTVIFDSLEKEDRLKSLKNESFIREASPLLQSYKEEATVLEMELQRAKQNELKHKAGSMSTLSHSTLHEDIKTALAAVEKDTTSVKEPDPVSLPIRNKAHQRVLIDSIQAEMDQSRQSHMDTVKALSKSQEVLQTMEKAAEEKCREQREIIQRLTQGVKEKEQKLEETNRERSALKEERRRLFEETERLVREADAHNTSLQSQLEMRGKAVEAMNEELVRLKSISEREIRSKDDELQTAHERMERVIWERDELIAETNRILQQADRDSELLRHNIRVREGQLDQVNQELEQQRVMQQTLVEQTMSAQRRAEESQKYMKAVVNEKDDQLQLALEQLERMRALQIQLTEESHALTDQADENTATMRRLLALKEEQVKDVMKQLDILRAEKQHLESNTASLTEEARSSSSTISSLQGMVKKKEADLKATQSELHQLKTFLRSATETEKVARQKMEKFIDDLISRAEKAESELRALRSRSSSAGLDSESSSAPRPGTSDAHSGIRKEEIDAMKQSLHSSVSPPKPPRKKKSGKILNEQLNASKGQVLRDSQPMTNTAPSSVKQKETTVVTADVHHSMFPDNIDAPTASNPPVTNTEKDAVIHLLNDKDKNNELYGSDLHAIGQYRDQIQLGNDLKNSESNRLHANKTNRSGEMFGPTTVLTSVNDDRSAYQGFIDNNITFKLSHGVDFVHPEKRNSSLPVKPYAQITRDKISRQDRYTDVFEDGKVRTSKQYLNRGFANMHGSSEILGDMRNPGLNYVTHKMSPYSEKRHQSAHDLFHPRFENGKHDSRYTLTMANGGLQNGTASQKRKTQPNSFGSEPYIMLEDKYSNRIPEDTRRYEFENNVVQPRLLPSIRTRSWRENIHPKNDEFRTSQPTYLSQDQNEFPSDTVRHGNLKVRSRHGVYARQRYGNLEDTGGQSETDVDFDIQTDSEPYSTNRLGYGVDGGRHYRPNDSRRSSGIGSQMRNPRYPGRKHVAGSTLKCDEHQLNSDDFTIHKTHNRHQKGRNNRVRNALETLDQNQRHYRSHASSKRPVAIGRSPDSDSVVKPKVSRHAEKKRKLINPEFTTDYPSSHKSMVDLHDAYNDISGRNSDYVQGELYRRSRSLSPIPRHSRISGLTNDEIGKYREYVRMKREAYARANPGDTSAESDEDYGAAVDHVTFDDDVGDTADNFNKIMDENGILWDDDMDTLPDVSDTELDRVSPSGSEAIATKKTNITTVHSNVRSTPNKQTGGTDPQRKTQVMPRSIETNKSEGTRHTDNSKVQKRAAFTIGGSMGNSSNKTETSRKEFEIGKSTNKRLNTEVKVNVLNETDKKKEDRESKLFRPIKSPKEVRNSLSDKDMSSGGREVSKFMRKSPKSFSESIGIKSHKSSGSSLQSTRESKSKSSRIDKETLDEKLKRISEKYKSQRSATPTYSGSSTVDDKLKSINDKYKQKRNDIMAGKGVSSINAPAYRDTSPNMNRIRNTLPSQSLNTIRQPTQSVPNISSTSNWPLNKYSLQYKADIGDNTMDMYKPMAEVKIHPLSSASMPSVHQIPHGNPNLFQVPGYPQPSFTSPSGQPYIIMPGMTPQHFQQLLPHPADPNVPALNSTFPQSYQAFAHPLNQTLSPNPNQQEKTNSTLSQPSAVNRSSSSNTTVGTPSDVNKTRNSCTPHNSTNSLNTDGSCAKNIPSVTVNGKRNTNDSRESIVSLIDTPDVSSSIRAETGVDNSKSHLSRSNSRQHSPEMMHKIEIKPTVHVQAVRSPTEQNHITTIVSDAEASRTPVAAADSDRGAQQSPSMGLVSERLTPNLSTASDTNINAENLLQPLEDGKRAKSAGEIEDYSDTFDDYSRSAGEISRSLRMSSGSLSSLDMPVAAHSRKSCHSPILEKNQSKRTSSITEGFSLFAEPIEDECSIAGYDSNTQSLLDLRGNLTDTDFDTDTESGRRGDFTVGRTKDMLDHSYSDYSEVYRMKSSRNVTSSASSQASIDLLERIPLSRREEVKRRRQVLSCIFSFLDTASLCRVAEVCREWKIVARSAKVWQRIELRNEKVSPKFLLYLAKRCSQLKVLVLEDLRPRTRRKSETAEQYQASIRGCLEGPFEQIMKKSESTLHTISIVNCGELLSAKSLWTASCHSRMLRHVTYLSDTDPINNEVMWALGSGCRDLKTLQIHPIIPCKRPENFNTRCAQLIGKCFPELQTLSLGGPDVDVNALIFIAKQCQLLRSIELNHMSLITEDIAEKMCEQGLDNLKTIRFVATPVASECLLTLKGRCEHLENITINLSKADYFRGTKQPENTELYEEQVRKYDALKDKSAFRKILKLHVDRSLKMALNKCLFD